MDILRAPGRRSAALLVVLCLVVWNPSSPGQQRSPGRPLSIEDYYRIQTVGAPQNSPNGKWIAYTISTRIEEDNSTRVESWLVSTDGAANSRRILHYGRDVNNPHWSADNRLEYSANGLWRINPDDPSSRPVVAEELPRFAIPSPDGKWIAQTKDRPLARQLRTYTSDFERRHQERFKGVIFDWKDFQRDGAPFPAPDPRARPAEDIVIAPAGGGESKKLTNMDLRPESLAWHPNGLMLAFIADSHWREELSYERSDLWTVTLDGKVT